MKKVLLSTTALVAASFLTAGIANAEVSISAAQTYLVKYSSGTQSVDTTAKTVTPGAGIGAATVTDDDAHKVSQSLTLEQVAGLSEITVAGSGTTDAGLSYGIDVQLRPQTSGVGTDEATVFIGGDSWGTISLGEDDDALDDTKVGAGSVLVGLGGEFNDTGHSPAGNDDYARIKYSTPSFSGFNAAISFAPQAGGADTALDSENLIALGANFKQDFGNMSVKVGGGMRMQSMTNRTTAAVMGVDVNKASGSLSGLQAGVVGTFDAFSVGIGFGMDSGKDSISHATLEKETNDTLLNFGVAYKFGMGGVSVGYYSLSREIKNVGAVKQSSSSIIVDADYKLAEGLTALLEVVMDSSDPDTDADAPSGEVNPNAMEIAFGMKAAF